MAVALHSSRIYLQARGKPLILDILCFTSAADLEQMEIRRVFVLS